MGAALDDLRAGLPSRAAIVGEEARRRRGRSARSSRCGVARARRASRRRAGRRAGTRRGSTSGRRRASAAARAARRAAESTPASRSISAARGVDLDVKLVARRAVERVPAVGADLRADAEVAQQRERAPRGWPRSRGRGGPRARRARAGATCPPSGRAPRARRAGSSGVAARSRRARRAARQRATSSSASRRRLYSTPSDPNEPIPPAATTRWHGTNGASRLRAQNVPGRTRRSRMPGERGELAVGDDLAARHGPQRAGALAVEAVVEVELDVGEVVRLAGEERVEPPREAAASRDPTACARRPRQLRPDDALALEPHLADAPTRAPRTGRASASPPRCCTVARRCRAAP